MTSQLLVSPGNGLSGVLLVTCLLTGHYPQTTGKPRCEKCYSSAEVLSTYFTAQLIGRPAAREGSRSSLYIINLLVVHKP